MGSVDLSRQRLALLQAHHFLLCRTSKTIIAVLQVEFALTTGAFPLSDRSQPDTFNSLRQSRTTLPIALLQSQQPGLLASLHGS